MNCGTTTTIGASTLSAGYGSAVTFTATVIDGVSGGPTPNGGTVTFLDGGSVIGSAVLTSGNATFSTSSLIAGSHTITASYSGEGTVFGDSATAVGASQSILILAIGVYPSSVAEKQPPGTIVGSFVTKDPNADDAFT